MSFSHSLSLSYTQILLLSNGALDTLAERHVSKVPITCVCFSPSSHLLAAGCEDGIVYAVESAQLKGDMVFKVIITRCLLADSVSAGLQARDS